MAADLHRLVYYSRNRILGTPLQVAAEVDGILAASRRNNSRVGVTGALIFNDGIFGTITLASVPEPPSAVLLGLGMIVLCGVYYGKARRRRASARATG